MSHAATGTIPADWGEAYRNYRLGNESDVPSPALVIDAGRVEDNLREMLRQVPDPDRLRPHVKTHKMAWVTRRLLELGVGRFKCATLAEAEMCARAGARDILVAYPVVGPAVVQLLDLQGEYPEAQWSTLIDGPPGAEALSDAAVQAGSLLGVWIDLDVGMHRTGIDPGAEGESLYRLASRLPGLQVKGLHAYDGHIQEGNVDRRTALCEKAFGPVRDLAQRLVRAGLPAPAIVAGGSPTFPCHARRPEVECSPGTTVFWDAGYRIRFPDLNYHPAARLLTRVVSRPRPGHLCLDLGHKAVASENPHPRVLFPDLPDARAVSHSEEHLVVQSSETERWQVGSVLYGIPWHVCPTVALYQDAVLVRDGQASEILAVTARHRRVGILGA